ncbi:hypothetical protein NEUTE1DRAFT_137762 [Neurospora tetrasperma FGSC 2508]|uniref:Uncharacterized protein n=1 Tax=Neurospora tetrasperma (strain FGSC 2508 / ATCC MYA-4615 / P0657) TaxID=510951 RepID=F8MMX5_NEUT8|nr:uncharacterized protein NEUTE1DRAFT_137762 [Neurospora tetrasperma FGSC 2508]EGO57999.1 hypothetical protein NEUTE1DRAFT_137762 [Neurospora tetrasperma FGSC 2508]EGZ71697.1 hypothetical protein NEUTE2DRAFT_166718 [Neurospora tetrasperma FGSC 2509]
MFLDIAQTKLSSDVAVWCYEQRPRNELKRLSLKFCPTLRTSAGFWYQPVGLDAADAPRSGDTFID